MSTEARVTRLEEALAGLAEAQTRTERNLDRLSDEMREFKDEMGSFKDQSLAISEQSQREWRRQMGELSNRLGTLVEDIVAPGVPELFRQRFGIKELDLSALRLRVRHRVEAGRSHEFDYVVIAGNLVLINETKSTLRPEDIPTFVNVLRDVRSYLPQAEGREVIGSMASFMMDPSLVTAGERQGLLMFGLGTGLLQVLNSPGFEPSRF